MITARSGPQGILLAQLEQKAAILAKAHAEAKLQSRRADPVRWRNPRLLWPLMTGDY